jgi:hypothetical protein
MEVCAGCGILAPLERQDCKVCGAALSESRLAVPARDDAQYWVGVRCRFQCRSCGHLSPLDHLDMDGSVVCLHCGLSQVFDVGSWDEGLAHAHAAGDLAGPNPEGRHPNPRISIAGRNPFKNIGRSHTSAELAQSGMTIGDGMIQHQSLRVDAAPGHPLCEQCRRPLTIALMSATRSTAKCIPCQRSVDHELPPQAPSAYPPLKAVIAEEQALGQRQAKVDQPVSGGAIGIRCPNCDAALTVTGTSQIVTCSFCHASARIPARTFHQLGHDNPEPLVWWMLFAGRSEKRAELERESSRPPSEDDAPPLSLPRGSSPVAEPARARRVYRGPTAAIAVVLPLAVAAAVGYIGFGDRIRAWSESARKHVDDAAFVDLEGCSCSTDVQLAIAVTEAGPRDRPLMGLSYRLTAGNRAVVLRAEHHTAPPSQTSERAMGLGIACTGDTVVIAEGKAVTAWRTPTGEAAWTHMLDRPFERSGSPPRTGLDVTCKKLLVKGDVVRVPIAGTDARIRVTDGTDAK